MLDLCFIDNLIFAFQSHYFCGNIKVCFSGWQMSVTIYLFSCLFSRLFVCIKLNCFTQQYFVFLFKNSFLKRCLPDGFELCKSKSASAGEEYFLF